MNTMQQEFDAVVAHLYKQGRPAVQGEACLYRSEYGGKVTMCAVGYRIPDGVYKPEMDEPQGGDGTGVRSLVKNFGNVLPAEIVAYVDMFEELQRVHDYDGNRLTDGSFYFPRLAERLKEIAATFGLTFTEPQQGA